MRHIIGWAYQILLWALLILGSVNAAYQRLSHVEPPKKPLVVDQSAWKNDQLPAYTIR